MAAEEIGPQRTADRATGVLRHHQPAQRSIGLAHPRRRPGTVEPDRRAHRQESPCRPRSNGRARAPRRRFLPDHLRRACGRRRTTGCVRMISAAWSGCPASQARIDCMVTFFERERAARDQLAADRDVGVTVLRRVADAQVGAVGELDAAGALNVEKERVDRVVDPEQLEAAPVERARLHAGAVGERHQSTVAHAHRQAAAHVVRRGRRRDRCRPARAVAGRAARCSARCGAGCRGAAARSSR